MNYRQYDYLTQAPYVEIYSEEEVKAHVQTSQSKDFLKSYMKLMFFVIEDEETVYKLKVFAQSVNVARGRKVLSGTKNKRNSMFA